MLTFLRPYPLRCRVSYHHRRERAEENFFRVRRAAPANRLRLVQRRVIAAEKTYLINERAEHEQRMEPGITCCRGHRTHQYEYADPREIFRSQRSQMVFALYQGIDHIERFCQGHKAEEPAAAGEKVILVTLIFIEILRKKQGAQEIVHRRVNADEGVQGKRPVLDEA